MNAEWQPARRGQGRPQAVPWDRSEAQGLDADIEPAATDRTTVHKPLIDSPSTVEASS